MFKINELTLISENDEEYTYKFFSGVNYFRGKNNSGKTEFYSFIDYMFGSSEKIYDKFWYKDSLKKATMIFEIDQFKYCISRTRNYEHNYLHYFGEEEGAFISSDEYRDKLNAIFSKDIRFLRELHNFTGEDLTFRTFTMFNFLGEKRQGVIQDFLDKCSEIRYSVKLGSILNFIFNKNLERIRELQGELEKSLKDLKNLENKSSRYDFVINKVNDNLQLLGGKIEYNGTNGEKIKKFLADIKNMEINIFNNNGKNIVDLEIMFNNITEQIKQHKKIKNDLGEIERKNKQRETMLKYLEKLLEENRDFEDLILPIQKLLREIDENISFGKYVIKDKTIESLEAQRKELRKQIKWNNSKFQMYTLEEKSKSIAVIEDYLTEEICFSDEEIERLRKRIREIKKELKELQSADDRDMIDEMSKFITDLYYSAKGISSIVEDDVAEEGYKIKYIKRGNILQPMIMDLSDRDEVIKKEVNYYKGSMARHTLIQLCGYLAFLKILIKDNRYPLIPMLVIDHVSKPFDEQNRKAIGKVISKALESIGKENMQIFMFDDEEYTSLEIEADHFEDLVDQEKTGFNPFFTVSLKNDYKD